MEQKPLYNILTPIIYVNNLKAEKQFYLDLGFTVSYEADDIPGFLGLAFKETIEFGLQQKDGFNATEASKQFVWQIGANSLHAITDICKAKGYEITESPTLCVEEWNLWEIKVKSPNGYEVTFEGPPEFEAK